MRKHNWLAAVVGILLTGVPVLWFTSWLQKQGEAEALIMANRAIGLLETRIDEASALLQELAGKVDTCTPTHQQVLRRAVFLGGAVKELALVAPAGQTLCTDSGEIAGNRDALASTATSRGEIMLDVVRPSDLQERMLRIRRLSSPGKPQLAALIPASLLFPSFSQHAGGPSGYLRMTLPDGTLIGTAGYEPLAATAGDDYVSSRQRSERYGPAVSVMMTRDGVIATYDDLRRIGMVVSGLLALVILGTALLVPWRQRRNPMSEIERAMMAGEFIPYYQPIVDIKSGGVLGAEVLVRWRKADGSLVPPAAFVPLLESSGLIVELTRSLMWQVCREVGAMLRQRPSMYISFNVAARHFADSVLLNDVGSIFDGSPIQFSQVVLEVTERHELQNLTATRRVIAALQALGCRVALDDVGTGHSGLSYILKLGVDIIKIDKIFVEAIKTEPQSRAIVETMVDLARNLDMQIVAEGVEHFEQVAYLREHGIYAAQGFVFAPPLPGPAFLQLVEALDPRPATGPAESTEPTPAPPRSARDRRAAA